MFIFGTCSKSQYAAHYLISDLMPFTQGLVCMSAGRRELNRVRVSSGIHAAFCNASCAITRLIQTTYMKCYKHSKLRYKYSHTRCSVRMISLAAFHWSFAHLVQEKCSLGNRIFATRIIGLKFIIIQLFQLLSLAPRLVDNLLFVCMLSDHTTCFKPIYKDAAQVGIYVPLITEVFTPEKFYWSSE